MIRNSTNPLTFAFYRFTSVVRFDLSTGFASETRTFSLPQVEPEVFGRFKVASDDSLLKIHNDAVVVWTPGSFMVGNLRQGEMTMVTELVSRRQFEYFHV